MTMNNKIVDMKVFEPENFKKALLIANKYRRSDIAIMVGSALAFGLGILLFIFKLIPLVIFIIFFFLLPALLAFLVQPLNNYHNHLEWIRLKHNYRSTIKHYSCFSKSKKLNKKDRKVGKNSAIS